MRERAFTIAFLLCVSAVFTGAVAGLNLVSRQRVALNRKIAKRRALLHALGIQVPEGASPQQIADLYERRVGDTKFTVEWDGERRPVLAGYSEDGELTAYALEISGQGFWDVLRGYLAISPDLKEMQGLVFYQQTETPGLGAEITKHWFEKQFAGQALPPEGGGSVGLKRPDEGKGPYDVDAVSGATGTSQAVERLLNKGLRRLVVAIQGEGGDTAPSP
jgi:Na+-transporting NADH:ubiquinone oxidoreductase subunit C